MQFQPPAVIVVLQEICQIAHEMEMGIDWIAHGENAASKVIKILVFPVCPLQRRPFQMVINSDGVSLSERHEGLFRDENCSLQQLSLRPDQKAVFVALLSRRHAIERKSVV